MKGLVDFSVRSGNSSEKDALRLFLLSRLDLFLNAENIDIIGVKKSASRHRITIDGRGNFRFENLEPPILPKNTEEKTGLNFILGSLYLLQRIKENKDNFLVEAVPYLFMLGECYGSYMTYKGEAPALSQDWGDSSFSEMVDSLIEKAEFGEKFRDKKSSSRRKEEFTKVLEKIVSEYFKKNRKPPSWRTVIDILAVEHVGQGKIIEHREDIDFEEEKVWPRNKVKGVTFQTIRNKLIPMRKALMESNPHM